MRKLKRNVCICNINFMPHAHIFTLLLEMKKRNERRKSKQQMRKVNHKSGARGMKMENSFVKRDN